MNGDWKPKQGVLNLNVESSGSAYETDKLRKQTCSISDNGNKDFLFLLVYQSSKSFEYLNLEHPVPLKIIFNHYNIIMNALL